MSTSKVQQALEQLQKIETLKQEAIQEILTQRDELDGQLRTLGFVVEGRQRRQRRVVAPDTPCPICNYITTPPHDARKHRGQGQKKKAFTVDELKELGLTKLAKGTATA